MAIFYKIFTHRPVIDLCASSPKKYAETPAFIHRMNIITQSRNAKSYSRQENNHWRVVAWDALRNSAAALAENQEILRIHFVRILNQLRNLITSDVRWKSFSQKYKDKNQH